MNHDFTSRSHSQIQFQSQNKSPFPGLRPFRQEEDYLFFGREEQTLELLRRLGSQRFVAVVGTSGSGKSSLVRCGLLSELLGGKMLQAGASWEVAVTHPGGNPLALLADALLEADLYDRNEEHIRENLLATLSRSHFGLVEAVKQAGLAPDTNFLLVVDQFEELFRFHEAGQTQQEVANEFVSVLLEAAAQTEVPIFVVLTMRSDFIGECGQFEGLAEMVNRGEFLIPRLTREQYKRVIEGPIKVAGGQITPRLLQRLLNDLGQQADQLPCLQHALMRTWSIRSEKDHSVALDLDDYQRVGRMAQALSLHADEVYESLSNDRQRVLCQGVFQALTVQETDSRGIRRPQRLGTLCEILEVSTEELIPIIEAYRHQGVTFLMPPPEVELTDKTIIDISHESLMRVWTRLRYWVEDEAQAAGIYRRLSESAGLYERGKAGLYRDPELGIALSWRDTRHPNQAWAERYNAGFSAAMRYLDASQQASLADQQAHEQARQHELEQVRTIAESERQRAESENRAARRLRGMVAGLAIVACFAVMSSIVAFNFWRTAEAAKQDAQLSEQSARRNAEAARNEAARATEQESAAKDARRDAEENLTSARSAIDDFMINVSESQLMASPGLQPLRAELLASASRFYEEFLNKNPNDPRLLAGLADAFYRVGFVNNELGNHEQALKALQKSSDLRLAALKSKPNDELLRDGLAASWFELSRARIDGNRDFAGAEESAIESARLWNALTTDHPEKVAYKKSLARAYNVVGIASSYQNASERSFLAYQQSLQIRLDLLPDHPEDIEVLHGLAESFNNLGMLLSEPEQRLVMLRRSIEFNVEVQRLRPQNVEYALDLSIGYSVTAQTLVAMNRRQEAFASYRAGIDHMLRFIRANPAVPAMQEHLQMTLTAVRQLAINSEQADEYARIFQLANEVYAELPRKTPEEHYSFAQIQSDGALQIRRARALIQKRALTSLELAEINALQTGAVDSLRQAIAAGFKDADRLKQDPLLTSARTHVAFAELIGAIDGTDRKPVAANSDPANPIPTNRVTDPVRLEQDRAIGLQAFGALETIFGRNEQAQKSLEQALTIRRKLAESTPEDERLQVDLQSAHTVLGNLYWKTGRLAQAREVFLQRVSWFEEALRKKPEDVGLATKLAAAHRALGDSLASAALWDEATLQYAAALKVEPTQSEFPIYFEILAPVRLLLVDDQESYRAACAPILEKFSAETDSEHATRVARLCALIPGAVGKEKLSQIVTLAEKAKTGWHAYTHALVLYRAERFEEAIQVIEEARKRNDLAGFHLGQFVLAMAHFQLGRQDSARELLDSVNRQSLQSMPAWTHEQKNMLDVDWLVLRREANGLIYGSPYSAEDRFRRSWAYAQLGDLGKADTESAALVAARPDDPRGHVMQAYVLAERGRKQQAEQSLDEATPRMLDRSSVGWLSQERADRSALESQPTNAAARDAELWRIYAESLLRLGKQEEAIRAYRRNVAAQSIVVINAPRQATANHRLLFEQTKQLIDALQASNLEADAKQALAERDMLLSVFGLPPETENAIDLLARPDPSRFAPAEALRSIDRLLASNERNLASNDSVFLHLQAHLHRRKAELAEDLGQEQPVAAELASASRFFSQVLESNPDDANVARELADTILANIRPKWSVLSPTEFNSKAGAALALLDDKSILASGTNPSEETYGVTAKSSLSSVTAFRLEVIPHFSLPQGGLGRDRSGWFTLNEFTVNLARTGGSPSEDIQLRNAVGSHSRKALDGREFTPQLAIDGLPTGWDTWPEVGRRQWAVFDVPSKLDNLSEASFFFQLASASTGYHPAPGRFRISITDDPTVFGQEQRRGAAMSLTDPWTKLVAAHRLAGDQQAVDKLVQRRPQAAAGLGDLYAADRDWAQAIRSYDSAITPDSTDALLIAKRAAAFAASGQWEQAKADWLRAIQYQPGLQRNAFDRCRLAGRWTEAAPFGLMLVEQNPTESMIWLNVAPILVLANDEDGYRAFCKRMADQFSKTEKPEEAERTCKACLLIPGAIEMSQLPANVFTTVLDNGKAPDWLLTWAWSCRALVAYRSGDAESAVRHVQKSQSHNPAVYTQSMNLTILALAQYQLGEVDAARSTREQASQLINQLSADDRYKGHDLWIAQILLREAESQAAAEAAGKK